MKRIIPFLLLLLASPALACDHFTRAYGTQTTLDFCLYITDATVGAVKVENAAHASGDTYLMKDEGNEANTTNGFTDEGSCYSIVLTATEMQAARILVNIEDQSTKVWADKCLVVETYGNASAQFGVSADVNVVSMADDTITAAKIAADAIGASEIATDAIGAAEIATDAIGAAEIAASAVGASEIATDAIGSAEVADGAVDAGALATDTITAAKIAADAITSSEIATDAIGAAELAADSIASSEIAATGAQEVADSILATTVAELSALPSSATPTVAQMLRWYYQYGTGKYKTLTTNTEKTLMKDDGSTPLGTCTTADDGTTYTRGECS